MSDGFDEEEDGPAENEIKDDGETGILQPPEDFVEDAEDGQEPDDAETDPSFEQHIVLDELHADGRITRCYQNIDRDMVEFAQDEFAFGSWFPEMIGDRCQVHQQHTNGEEGYAEGILPVLGIAEPYQHPRNGEHHEETHQMCAGIEKFGSC